VAFPAWQVLVTGEPFTKDSGEHTDMGDRPNGDNSNLPSDEPEPKSEDPDLSSLPELEIMTPSRTPHAEEQEADAIVAGEEEKHPCKPSRAPKPIERLGSGVQAPEPARKPKARTGKPPSEYTGRLKKAGRKGKAEVFAIDSVADRWTDENGVKWASVHWEGYPDSDNTPMTEKHALRQGYKDLIEYYDSEKAQAPEEVAPKEHEPAKEATYHR